MTEIDIRIEGRAGRITLNRPAALNALTHDQVRHIVPALTAWAGNPDVALVMVDAAGDRAFCAGGDIATLYAQIVAGDLEPGRAFWRDEYRMNAQIARYPKPVVSFLQGFTMGGGVGLGCHASHRIVGDTSRVAMPECSIGLVPDVGGSLLLARAPGRMGEYLGLTASRMTGPDAIFCGFADHYLPESAWPALKAQLAETGDARLVAASAAPCPASPLAPLHGQIDRLFSAGRLGEIVEALAADPSDFARETADKIARNAPLAMAACLRLIAGARAVRQIEAALMAEYRYSHRSVEQGDFAEGIRARIIDKDNAPRWQHSLTAPPSGAEVAAILAPLEGQELTWETLS